MSLSIMDVMAIMHFKVNNFDITFQMQIVYNVVLKNIWC